MGYKVDYGAMRELMGTYNDAVGIWSDGISSVLDKGMAIEASTNIAGNRAANMKQYLGTAYLCAKDMFVMLFSSFQQKYLLYTNAYLQQIDPAGDVHVDSEELSRLHESLKGKRSQFQQIGVSAEGAVGKVADLVTLPSLDIGEADTLFGQILSSLDELDTDINSLENAHVSADFAEIDEMISRLDAYLIELIGQNKEFKTSFSSESFVALASVPGLIKAMHDAYDQLSAQESDVAAAMTNLEKILAKEQAELEKRQEQVKWAKAAVKVVTTIAVVACVASGTGTLLVPVICGVGKSAFNVAADEYVTHGWNTDQWDSALIGKEAVKGWFSGFTSAILPPGTGDIVKAGLSSANSALWSGLDNAYDQMTTTGTISDTKSIFFDAEKSGVSSFAGNLVGNAISDQIEDMPIGLGLDKYTNPSNDIRHYAGKFIVSGTDKMTSGIGERLTSTTVEVAYDAERNSVNGKDALEGIDLADRYKDVLSLKEIGSDFFSGGSKEVLSSYIKERTPDKDTGLTPIVQSKLSYETDPETGLTGAVQDSLSHIVDEDEFSDILKEMEERNPSTGSVAVVDGSQNSGGLTEPGESRTNTAGQSIDWEHTSNTPEEIRQLEEMERNGEIEIHKVNPNLAEPERGTPHLPSESGTFSGERGNSAFYPKDQTVVDHMRQYGQDYVTYRNNEVDFSPFTKHESPWGKLDCQVEIGHMTDQRQNPTWEYGRRPAGAGHDPNYDLGNFAQADNALLDRIRETNPDATMDDVTDFIKSNHLTWHECADGKTMQLVPTDIHDASRHSGGVSEMKYRMAMGDVELPDE